MAQTFDAIVIGAGMAGASVAYFLSRHARVLVIEREPHPGMHTTGRSAAMFTETYGSPQVRGLTRASRPFFDSPPEGFAAHPLLRRRGELIIASSAQEASLQAVYDEVRQHSPQVRLIDSDDALAMVPVLLPESASLALHDESASDIDVNELHQGFLRGMRALGGEMRLDVQLESIVRRGGVWQLEGGGQAWQAPLLINAAGAWVDQVAALAGVSPIGIQPRRRSAFLFGPPEGVSSTNWPLVIDADETFYFKPDAGLLLGSPANADPTEPHDVQPEELDIATGIHRIESATTLRIRRPTRTWAGLRSFVSDGDLVGGPARDAPGFFWAAAQGGYGIQTGPAMGQACAAMALGLDWPDELSREGLAPAMLWPRG